MSARLLISVRPGETRGALVEDGRMIWFDFIRTLHDALPPAPVGTVFLARIRKVEPGLGAAFVELEKGETALLALRDARALATNQGTARAIEKLVHEGEAVIVQISRLGRDGKGPRVTADPALPGPEGKPVRPRRGEETPLWAEIGERARTAKPPALLWRPREPEPAVTLWREAPVRPDVTEVDHEGSAAALRRALAESGDEGEILTRRDDVFSAHGLDEAVDGLSAPTVVMRAGASLIIETGAALTAIDVNAGSALGSTVEDTALKVNLDAAREIARQIALRRLGGIVAIDFLRLKAARHRREVITALREALRTYRLETTEPGFTRAGLVEFVLPRRATPLHERLMSPCPHCNGRGYVPHTAGHALALLAHYVREARSGAARPLEVRAAPEIIGWLSAREGAVIRELERFAVAAPAWRAEIGWPPDRMDVRPRDQKFVQRRK